MGRPCDRYDYVAVGVHHHCALTPARDVTPDLAVASPVGQLACDSHDAHGQTSLWDKSQLRSWHLQSIDAAADAKAALEYEERAALAKSTGVEVWEIPKPPPPKAARRLAPATGIAATTSTRTCASAVHVRAVAGAAPLEREHARAGRGAAGHQLFGGGGTSRARRV